ncbi:MAG: hypothetical protein HY686_07860 [Chloroflexi bacterium]|nr:hypothetical protein [Chloroflexota bacterium]
MMQIGFRRPFLAPLALALLLVLLVGACGKGSNTGASRFPDYVYATSLSLESYRAAASLPDRVITQMPCYCGCEAAPSRHRDLKDCFYLADGSYNDHAAGCDLCGKIATDVAAGLKKGKSLKEIRSSIDGTYAVYGRPTETPPVQE